MDNRGTGKAGGSCQCDWSRWGHGTLDYTDRSSQAVPTEPKMSTEGKGIVS